MYGFSNLPLSEEAKEIENRQKLKETFDFMKKLPKASDQNKLTKENIQNNHKCNICFTEFKTEIEKNQVSQPSLLE